MDRSDEKDGGINPLFAGVFSEAALDAPTELQTQHRGVRGKWGNLCGVSEGQTLSDFASDSAVTCVRCGEILAARKATRAKRAAMKGGR